MSVRQPSLWDNIPLEEGYRCMYALQLDEAIEYFNEASQSKLGDPQTIQNAIITCRFWKGKLENVAISPASIAEILKDFSEYHFTRLITEFKKTLLRYITNLLKDVENFNLANVEFTFDLLLKTGDFQNAEELILEYLERCPEKYHLLYLLAQAQWCKKNKTEARINYAKALLYFPDKKYFARIVPDDLKKIIDYSGPEMAPSYGWLRDVLPIISITDDIKFKDEKHAQAIKTYHLMAQAIEHEKSNDLNQKTHSRKELKKQDPELFKEYFQKVTSTH